MILDEIIGNRRRLLVLEKEALPLNELILQCEKKISSVYEVPDLLKLHVPAKPFLIAEIKKASPSRGVIRPDFDVAGIAASYGKSVHVSAVSVLTEPDYFLGRYEYMGAASAGSGKPVLMKDFVIDEYQVYRGFAGGASAFLLIASALKDSQIEKLYSLGKKLGMKILFEAHTAEEYRRGLGFGFELMGINNRDLKTFITDIHATIRIIDAEGLPKSGLVVSESGIRDRNDVAMLERGGAGGFLIGETFMRNADIEAAISALFGADE